MKRYKIEKFLIGRKIIVYSIREIYEDGTFDSQNETQKFFSSIKSSYIADYNVFKAVLKNILNKSGAQKKFFRDETNADCLYLYALINNDDENRHYSGELRLFCLNFGNDKLILGNGGIKKTRTFNEDPKLNTIARILQKLCLEIIEKEKNGDIWWENGELKSLTNLNFQIEL